MARASNMGSNPHIAIEIRRQLLLRSHHKWGDAKYIWVEKVTYKSSLLSNTYSVAASKATHIHLLRTSDSTLQSLEPLRQSSRKLLSKLTPFFSGISLFQKESKWKLEGSIVEAALFLPRLTSIRLDIFPRKNMVKDKYLAYIPLTWTACNNLLGSPLEGDLLWDMMVISMLNYQADEFMETIQDIQSPCTQGKVKTLINEIFSSLNVADKTSCNEDDRSSVSTEASCPCALTMEKKSPNDSTGSTLRKFVHYVVNHTRIIHAPNQNFMGLTGDLRKFLLAHVDHSADNALLGQQTHQKSPKFSIPECRTKLSLYDWVQNTAAIDTSCPYAFSWLFCRLATKNSSPPGVVVSYLKQDVTKHLAAMCRLHNDYGSLDRDIAESNVNSLNFREFVSKKPTEPKMAITDEEEDRQVRMDVSRMKSELMELAEHERSCMLSAKEKLLPPISKRERDVLEVFVSVTDLYGQIYVARDIASRLR